MTTNGMVSSNRNIFGHMGSSVRGKKMSPEALRPKSKELGVEGENVQPL